MLPTSLLNRWGELVRAGRCPAEALGHAAPNSDVRIQQTSSARVAVLRQLGPKPIVVKWWGCHEWHEVDHLQWLHNHPHAGAPRLLWDSKVIRDAWRLFAMEFLEGERMDKLLRRAPHREAELSTRALEHLAKVHALIDADMQDLELRGPYWGKNLEERLADDLSKVIAAVAPASADLARRLSDIGTQHVAHQVSNPEQRVLGHGDYKANNLFVVDTGSQPQIRPIDWVDMGQAAPWYDLAYLLAAFPECAEHAGLEVYLRRARAYGLLAGTGTQTALELLRYGQVARLTTSAASRACRAPGDPRFLQRCRELKVAWRRCLR